MTSSAFRINWGLGLDYWITQRWALSANATNPFLSISYQRTEQTGGALKESTFDVGAIFEPGFLIMAHLYF